MSLTPVALLRSQTMTDDCPAPEWSGETDYLQSLLDAAEEWVCLHTHRPLEELTDATGGLAAPVRHAVLMLGAHWYNQREAVAGAQMAEVPFGVSTLLAPYRSFRRKSGETES